MLLFGLLDINMEIVYMKHTYVLKYDYCIKIMSDYVALVRAWVFGWWRRSGLGVVLKSCGDWGKQRKNYFWERMAEEPKPSRDPSNVLNDDLRKRLIDIGSHKLTLSNLNLFGFNLFLRKQRVDQATFLLFESICQNICISKTCVKIENSQMWPKIRPSRP